jgi:hypothetical protein
MMPRFYDAGSGKVSKGRRQKTGVRRQKKRESEESGSPPYPSNS